MNDYKHILLAVDFSPASRQAAARAVHLMQRFGSRLSLVHVVEYMPTPEPTGDWLAMPPQLEVEKALMENAGRQLEATAKDLGVGDAPRFVELGSPKHEIVRIATEQGADLIVLGSHGRHGLAGILGSTANAVLHVATCDVLAVRIVEE